MEEEEPEQEEDNKTAKTPIYVATLTNEMTLDDRDIFHFVEQFNILADRFDGEYIG
ncbi:ribonuclease E inhibitor RraB [Volucribacter amazonae]|uniref:ribonuclease E inhibitor RraB n=1 Tax=Volucribacter amazonae TaxID=256731 RepID=UPI003C717858